MKEIKMFQCEICAERYLYEKYANSCEAAHGKITEITYNFAPGMDTPHSILLTIVIQGIPGNQTLVYQPA